jgi:hypothetical protein
MGFSEVGEPSRLARGARITGEIWKINLKGSVAWDLLRGGGEALQAGTLSQNHSRDLENGS